MIDQEVFFEHLKEQKEKDLPFVAYRASSVQGDLIRAFFQHSAEIYKTSDFSEPGFVVAPFDMEKEVILFPKKKCEIHETVFQDNQEPGPAHGDQGNSHSNADRDKHIELVQKGIDAIKQGQFKKVVLSRKEVIHSSDLDTLLLFKRLLKKYPDAFVYLMHHPKVGTWLGATPEKLLEVERNRFRTMALAATQKYNDTIDVGWGEKELEEQQIVTDTILENLKDTVSNIKTTGPSTTRAGGLLHLKTDISGEIISPKENPGKDAMHLFSGDAIHLFSGDAMHRVSTLKKLITALHPTPAVCGLPKKEAKDFILEHENYNREFYTGFLGEINMPQEVKRSSNRRNQENQAYSSIVPKTSLFVNLRCMKITKVSAEIFVGGGITKESQPEAEWEETRNKAGTMTAVLDIYRKIE